jgi:hypothetical protein
MRNAMRRLVLIVMAILSTLVGCKDDPGDDHGMVKLSPDEKELYNLIADYRSGLGLPSIPLSASLSYVAQQHVADLENNDPVTSTCNQHSWSDNGNWTACCYTSDHAQASCMWDKPRELTDYTGNGYEIFYFNPAGASPAGALNAWKTIPVNNDVIINAGHWTMEWKALGVGIKGEYAVVWFGHENDPTDPPVY